MSVVMMCSVNWIPYRGLVINIYMTSFHLFISKVSGFHNFSSFQHFLLPFMPTWPWPDYNKVSATSYLQHICCFLLSFKNLPNFLYFFQLCESWSDQLWRETTHVVFSAAVPSLGGSSISASWSMHPYHLGRVLLFQVKFVVQRAA